MGQRIRSRRRFRRMTRKQLADRIGISLWLLRDIERGDSDPRFHVMVKICDALDLDIMDFVRDVKKGTE
jgi:transcriptional regulator with XRE-family HTH domain